MIEVQKSGRRWTITLNRPDKANALTLEMLNDLDALVASAQENTGIRCLILTGAGNRAFSAGADLDEARASADLTLDPVWERLSGRIAQLPFLTIAALNGTLAGGAFGMALACDLRMAVPSAKFFYPVLKNGFLPQPSDVNRLRALIGPARTKLILLAGQKLSADQAQAIGLIDLIVPRHEFEIALAKLTVDATSADRDILTAIKGICAQ